MVYVIQEQTGKNILSAKKFGDFKILLPPGLQVTFSAGQVANKLYTDLSNFNDADYLLLIGDPIAIGIAMGVAFQWNNGKVKVLKWDKQEHVYYPIEINLYEFKNVHKESFTTQMEGDLNG
jgi:hypothetical protein